MTNMSETVKRVTEFVFETRKKKDQMVQGYVELVCLFVKHQDIELEEEDIKHLRGSSWMFLEHTMPLEQYGNVLGSILGNASKNRSH